MSEIQQTIKPASEFPHNQWLVDNAEFVAANPLPAEFKEPIRTFKMLYGGYAKADESTMQKKHDTVYKKSIAIADMMQTFMELDLEEEESTPAATPAAVVIEDGIVTTEEEKETARLKAEQEEAERLAAEQPKEEGSGGWGWLVALGLAALGIGVAVNKLKK